MITLLKIMGNDICIVSGPTKLLIKEDLEKIKFFDKCSEISRFMSIYSVVDFLKESGVKTWEIKGNVWADDQSWWDSKAKICKIKEIDIMIDDSEKYQSAFGLIDCKFIHIDELI
jgi:hypothetical protein